MDELEEYVAKHKTVLHEFDSRYAPVYERFKYLREEYSSLKRQIEFISDQRRKLIQDSLATIRAEIIAKGRYIFVGHWKHDLPISRRVDYPLDVSEVIWGEQQAVGVVRPRLPTNEAEQQIYQKIIAVGDKFHVNDTYDSHKWNYTSDVEDKVLIALDRRTRTGTILVDIVE